MDPRQLIRDYLKESDGSQDELGRRVGLHRVTISRYLNGKIDLAGDRLLAILDEAGYAIVPRTGRLKSKRERERSRMSNTADRTAYAPIRDIVERHNGTMIFRAGGGPGGSWQLELENRELVVPVRDRRANRLDHLYVTEVVDPKDWNDWDSDAPLKPDAFWQLMKLMQDHGAAK